MSRGRDISEVDASEIQAIFDFHFIGLATSQSVVVGRDGLVEIWWRPQQRGVASAAALRAMKAATLPMALFRQLNLNEPPRLSF